MGSLLLIPTKELEPFSIRSGFGFSLFFDYAYTNDPDFPEPDMSSMGAEIIFDFEFPPLSVGFRYSRVLDGGVANKNAYELFIPSPRF